MAADRAYGIGRALRRIEAAIARRPATSLLVAVAFLSAVFLRFPGIDLWVSQRFFRAGEHFALSRQPLLVLLREFGSDLPVAVAVIGIAAILWKVMRPRHPSLLPPKLSWFLFLPWLTATVILVNGLMKPFWGRPRPRMVTDFGGDLAFAAAWTAGSCSGNCSFVSGESSAAATLFVLAILAPAAWRRPLAIVIGLLVLAISLNRVLFGGHFLSDVLLGWAVSLAVLILLHRLFFIVRPPWLADAALEARATRDGLAIQAGMAGLWHRLRRRRKAEVTAAPAPGAVPPPGEDGEAP
jgi:membrane-associated phospholipid phosphatase